MHRTHLPLLTWAHAIYLIVSSSKGVSAMKLSEMPGVSNATAWHLGHRIRLMMAEPNPILSGVVEIGEMYACAPPRKRAKLADFEDRFGITSEEVSPAYTSQTCSCCGYVDKRNRPSQSTFRCLCCGTQMHADVNAARNIGQRRALSIGSVFQSKASILAELVRQFRERRGLSTRSGGRGSTADPRLHNPYFGAEKGNAAPMSGQTKVPHLVLATAT